MASGLTLKVLQLTAKGIESLKSTGYDAKACREGIAHRYWKHKIAEYYKKQGYEVKIEEPVKHKHFTTADLYIWAYTEKYAQ
jgi:hypothetical protein